MALMIREGVRFLDGEISNSDRILEYNFLVNGLGKNSSSITEEIEEDFRTLEMGKSSEKQKITELEVAIALILEAEPIGMGSEIVEALYIEGKGSEEEENKGELVVVEVVEGCGKGEEEMRSDFQTIFTK